MSAAERKPDLDNTQGDGSVAYEITEPVDMAELEAQISQAMEWTQGAGLVAEGAALSEASEESPSTLWVTAYGAVDGADTILQVILDHEPSGEPFAGGDNAELSRLVEKAQTQDLTGQDAAQVLTLLLRHGIISVPS